MRHSLLALLLLIDSVAPATFVDGQRPLLHKGPGGIIQG